MMPRPSIPWPTLRYSLLLGLCLLVVGWCRWHGSSHLLLDAFQSTSQRGQPVLQPRFTQPNPFDPSTYLEAMPSMQESNPFVSLLVSCPQTANQVTSHRRVPARHLNISLTPPDLPPLTDRHFNPTFLRLPSWAASSPATKGAKYVLVTRKVTEGLHQESFICLADICLPSPISPDARSCTASDYSLLGPNGGLRCTTTPIQLDIPPTPALRCSGRWSSFPAFPGFHDPRIFWSNRGEPLMIVNSASQYGCLGLWLVDLRAVSADLASVLSRDGKRKSWESPVIRYRHLTELTRHDRAEVEKNWMLFFPGGSSSSDPNEEGDAVVQYDVAPKYDFSSSSSSSSSNDHSTSSSGLNHPIATRGRTLSLLHSNTGITIAANLTSPLEPTCFPPSSVLDSLGQRGHWHQSTNALKLILCTRADLRSGACGPHRRSWLSSGREVHFSIIHRKFSNSLDLPMRYERFAVVWEGRSPWRLLGVSQSPILFADEVAQPWTREENKIISSTLARLANSSFASSTPAELKQMHKYKRQQKQQQQQQQQKDADSSSSAAGATAQDEETSAYFTYTPSIAWAWRPATDHFDADEQHSSEHDSEHDIAELERLGMGFLGDDLLVGVGLDDIAQAVVRLKVDEIVGCLRLCE